MSRLQLSTILLVGMQLFLGWGGERVVAQEVWQQNLLDRYCVGCHNEQLETGGLALDRHDVMQVEADPAVWETVVRKLRAGAMPPAPMNPTFSTSDSSLTSRSI